MSDKKEKKTSKTDEKLLQQIAQLEKELEEAQEITKRAQSDYFRLKMDMDAYIQRAESNTQQAKAAALVSIAQHIIPSVEQLGQSVRNMPTDLADHPWSKGVALSYTKAINELKSIGIEPIPAEVGQDPDLTLHLPISTEQTADKSLQGKIITIVEGGYYYTKQQPAQVISPTKVIIGAE